VIATSACQMTTGPGTECPRRGVRYPLREGLLRGGPRRLARSA
jgi:hypothetical protein